MSKKCECGKKCKRTSQDGQDNLNDIKNYYIGVDDLTFYKAHYDVFTKEVVLTPDEEQDTIREFGQKFVDDPMIAMLNVFTTSSKESNDPEVREFFGENLVYAPDHGCFFLDVYLTKGCELPPKECQWERFFKGEYEFILVRHELQALETNLPRIYLSSMGKSIGYNKPIEEIESIKIEESYNLSEDTDEIHPIENYEVKYRYPVNKLKIQKFMKNETN